MHPRFYRVPQRLTTRICAGCGQPLRHDAPGHYRNCAKCWSRPSYRKAMLAFLDATKAQP